MAASNQSVVSSNCNGVKQANLCNAFIDKIDGEVVLKVDKSDLNRYISMHSLLDPWQEQAAKLRSGEITKEEYDKWRYNYPAYAGLPWVKTIPEIR